MWEPFNQLPERVQMIIVVGMVILILAIIAAIVLDRQAAADLTKLLVTLAAIMGGLGVSRKIRSHVSNTATHQSNELEDH